MSGFLSGRGGGGLAGGLSGGVKLAAVGLLVHQLMKHAQGERAGGGAAPARGEEPTTGGGLGGILGGLFGGGGTPAASAGGGSAGAGGLGALLGGGGLGGLLGGLGGMLGGMRDKGLGHHVDSWVSPGANQPVSAREIEAAFDPQELDEAARRAGTDKESLLNELSRLLPQFVDRATPRGQVPQREEDLGGGGFGGLLGSLFGGDGDRQPGGPAGSGGPYTRPR
ncbi:hypothetical protein GCM10009416_36680 [Craurococcus roseus]|uniref:DUF937 domain-containing protein n=1 Tax=Craurococcus roseus TaxID=77585 RepID=A0ABN1FPG8_9PROT